VAVIKLASLYKNVKEVVGGKFSMIITSTPKWISKIHCSSSKALALLVQEGILVLSFLSCA